MWYVVKRELPIHSLLYNFLPSWWHRGYGVDFGRRFLFDPEYRVECYLQMERILAERFPELTIGDPDPVARVVPPDFGNAATAAAAGCEIAYPQDNYPWNRHLEAEKIGTLRVAEDLASCFPYSEIVSQVQTLNRLYGRDETPLLIPRGVLNDAMLIRGQDFFVDRGENPQTARHLLDFCQRTLQSVVAFNAANGRSETAILTNCTVPFVGPQNYSEWLLPLDLEIYEQIRNNRQPFGVHHCGILDPYIPAYRRFARVDFLEIGWDSDIARTLAAFPESLVRYIYSAHFLLTSSRQEVERRAREILAQVPAADLRRFSLSVPDIEHGTADDKLMAILEACTCLDDVA